MKNQDVMTLFYSNTYTVLSFCLLKTLQIHHQNVGPQLNTVGNVSLMEGQGRWDPSPQAQQVQLGKRRALSESQCFHLERDRVNRARI